jgi:DNA-binding IscR family transcriptional regulator
LYEIVKVFDEATPFEECPLGLPGCAEGRDDCPAHKEWSRLQERVLSWWRGTTLASLVARNTPANIQKGLNAKP